MIRVLGLVFANTILAERCLPSHCSSSQCFQENAMIHSKVLDNIKSTRGFTKDEVLAALGLERRRSSLDVVLPALGCLAAGIAIGTGITLLFAPKSGREMRREIGDKATTLSTRLTTAANEVVDEVRGALPFAEKEADENGRRASKQNDLSHSHKMS